MSESPEDRLRIEKVLDREFEDPALIDLALTHASFAQEADGTRGNERLEFLGDAILGLVIAAQLFDAHPDWKRGLALRRVLYRSPALTFTFGSFGKKGPIGISTW